ncbi:MAG: hypothetical protein U1F26_15075 [Lysobacterales bacterium]
MKHPISDDELLLFHLGESLGLERMDAIACQLAVDPELAARYALLRRMLAASEVALAQHEPEAGLEQRLWARIAPQLQPPVRAPWWQRWGWPMLAVAASAGLLVSVTLQLRAPTEAPPITLAADASERVLAAHVARHLAQTERLLTVTDNGGVGADALAAALIDSNRLYALAAERAGQTQLAQFLTELEPILRELANAPEGGALGGADLVRQEIRSRDLMFRLRALEDAHAAPVQRL